MMGVGFGFVAALIMYFAVICCISILKGGSSASVWIRVVGVVLERPRAILSAERWMISIFSRADGHAMSKAGAEYVRTDLMSAL